jgi:hypothetical protein
MNKAFGGEKQAPVVQFNSLSTDAKRDEQRSGRAPANAVDCPPGSSQITSNSAASTTSRRRRELELAGIAEEIRSLRSHRLHD